MTAAERCAHLQGMWLPELALESSLGPVNVADLNVLYLFSQAGPEPDDTEAFRRSHAELRELGVHIGGLSAHPRELQVELAERRNLPFPLIGDPDLELAAALDLPTVEVEGATLYDRLTIVAWSGRIEKVFYPVVGPEENAEEVITWLDS
jgi:peroxiredoxin